METLLEDAPVLSGRKAPEKCTRQIASASCFGGAMKNQTSKGFRVFRASCHGDGSLADESMCHLCQNFFRYCKQCSSYLGSSDWNAALVGNQRPCKNSAACPTISPLSVTPPLEPCQHWTLSASVAPNMIWFLLFDLFGQSSKEDCRPAPACCVTLAFGWSMMEFMQHHAFKFSLPLTMFAQCFQPNTCHIMQHHAQKLGFARRRLLACWKRTLNLNLSHVKWNPCFCTISHIKRRFLVTCLASETRTKKTNTRPVRESDLSMHGLAWREISRGLFSHHHHCGILHKST